MLTRIAFERHGDTIPGLAKGIYTINPDGSDCRQIRANGMFPKWSPDGQWIAFREDTEDNEWLASIFIMRPDGQQVRRVTFHHDISVAALTWSPDSKWLAYSLWHWQEKRHQIYVINLESGQFHQITNGTDDNAYPVWTPNNEIVFSKSIDPQQSSQLFIMNPNGQNQRECNLFVAGDYEPVWTYDGKKFVFQRGDNYCVMNADGSGLQIIPKHGRVPQMILSPDGQYAAYSSCEDTGEAGFEILVMKLDGTEKRKIVSNPCSKNKEVDSQDISWSPVLQSTQSKAMRFYIYKNNQQFGPYEESAVVEWLRNGQCSPSDLAIREGMNEWQPLGTLVQMPVTTSGNLDAEFELFEINAEELGDLFSQLKAANFLTAKHLLSQYEQKLQAMERQVFSLKNQFPNTDEVEFMESFFYTQMSGLKMEQNNWIEALRFLDRAISVIDTPNVRIVRASVYVKLNQKQQALSDLNHIITNPVEDERLYFDARRMKDELENSFF